MGRMCKCQICKRELNTDTAFRYTDSKGKNKYYCSLDEFEIAEDNKRKAAKDKDRVYRLVCDIIGESEIINTVLFKEWQVWLKVSDNEKIAKYLEENEYYLTSVISRLRSTEFAKIRYLSTIIRDKIKTFVPKVEVKEVPKITETSISIDQTFEMYNGPTNINNRRRSFDEME